MSDIDARLIGMIIQANKAVVSKNAFSHESGIHQDGVLKHAATYEIITPEMIGLTSNVLFLGKHSGRHAFTDKVKELGYDLSEARLRSEEHTSELQSRGHLVCRLLLEKK